MPQLLPPSFLFRFAAPLRHAAQIWTPTGIELGPKFALPSFAQLDDAPQRVEVRAAWNEQGLSLIAEISGKKQPPWCRANRLEDSDGFYLWIDTRDTHNIHRASRFCHQFVFLPTGGGHRGDEPLAEMLAINRARENPKPVRPGSLPVVAKLSRGGYSLACHLPAAALTGFDPAEHPRLGFHWALVDRELGEHTFCSAPEFPYRDDPSVWGTLELQK